MKEIRLDLNSLPLWSEMYLIKYEINNSMYAIRKMIALQDESYESISKDLKDKILKLKSENQNLNEDDLESYVSNVFGSDEQLLIDLKRIQDFNKVISIYSLTESKLKTISIKIESDFNTDFDLNDTTSPFLKNLKFFQCFLQERFPSVEKHSTPVINLMKIRNIINHQDGIATTIQYKRMSDIKGIGFIEFDNMYYITVIEENFITNLLDKIEIFFTALLDAISLKTTELSKTN